MATPGNTCARSNPQLILAITDLQPFSHYCLHPTACENRLCHLQARRICKPATSTWFVQMRENGSALALLSPPSYAPARYTLSRIATTAPWDVRVEEWVSEWSTLFDTAMLTLLAVKRCSCSSLSIPGSGDGAQPAACHFGTDSLWSLCSRIHLYLIVLTILIRLVVAHAPLPRRNSALVSVCLKRAHQIDCEGLRSGLFVAMAMLKLVCVLAVFLVVFLTPPLVSQGVDEHVMVLTASNFEDYVGKDKGALVEFYAPW